MYQYLVVGLGSFIVGWLVTSIYYARMIQRLVKAFPPEIQHTIKAILRGEQVDLTKEQERQATNA